ncbi:MAG: ATP-binding protein, partial [Synergistaceae bacterium]|nr:ATP-binding protein [Synergistaceae bacterium]
RQHGRLQRLINGAKFENPTACIEDIRYDDDRKLDRNFILELASCNYVPHARNIVIVGPTGCGNYAKPEIMRSRLRNSLQIPDKCSKDFA